MTLFRSTMCYSLIILCFITICFLFILFMQQKKELRHWHWKATELEKLHTGAAIRYNISGKLCQKELLLKNIRKQGIERLYIYGGGLIGQQFFSLLQEISDIRVMGIIDKEVIPPSKFNGLPSCTVNELHGKFQKVDWIVITPIFAYDKILPVLLPHIDANHVITLDELLID